MQYTWQLSLGASPSCLVPVYFIKHSVSCYIHYIIIALMLGPLHFESTRESVNSILMVQIKRFSGFLKEPVQSVCSNPKFGTGPNFLQTIGFCTPSERLFVKLSNVIGPTELKLWLLKVVLLNARSPSFKLWPLKVVLLNARSPSFIVTIQFSDGPNSTIKHTYKEVTEVMEMNHTHQYETVDTPIEKSQNPVYSATNATNNEAEYGLGPTRNEQQPEYDYIQV